MAARVASISLLSFAVALAACSAEATVAPASGDPPPAGGSGASSSGGAASPGGKDASSPPAPSSCAFVALDTPITTNLRGVWGTSPDDVWVGSEGFSLVASANVLHFVKGAATKLATGNADGIQAIDGTSANDVWFVGTLADSSHTTILHYDGTALAIANEGAGTGTSLRAVWARAPDDVWAVGDARALHFSGGTWASPPAPLDPGLLDGFRGASVAGASAGSVLLGQASASALRWDGAKVTSGASTPHLSRLVHAAGGSYWGWDAVKGTLVKSADGSAWQTVRTVGKDEPGIVAIAARSDTDVWILTGYEAIPGGYDGPHVEHFDGATWQKSALEPGRMVADIAIAGDSVWVVGAKGYVARCMLE